MSKPETNKAEKPTPIVLAVNICDTIIRDETTKKVSLIGLFSVIQASNFPATHPMMHIYAAVTNGHGKYRTSIRFVRMDKSEEKLLAEINGELIFASPLQVVEINFCLQGLKFDKPGEHVVKIVCDDSEIGSRKFFVVLKQPKIFNTDGTEVK